MTSAGGGGADRRGLGAGAAFRHPGGARGPGLFATGRIGLERQGTLLGFPSDAVLREAGVHRVFVVGPDRRVQERVVVLTERLGQTVLIERGLQGGERVALGRLDRLSDGALVTE